MLSQGSEKLEQELDLLQILRKLRHVEAIVKFLQDDPVFVAEQKKCQASYKIDLGDGRSARRKRRTNTDESERFSYRN